MGAAPLDEVPVVSTELYESDFDGFVKVSIHELLAGGGALKHLENIKKKNREKKERLAAFPPWERATLRRRREPTRGPESLFSFAPV